MILEHLYAIFDFDMTLGLTCVVGSYSVFVFCVCVLAEAMEAVQSTGAVDRVAGTMAQAPAGTTGVAAVVAVPETMGATAAEIIMGCPAETLACQTPGEY